MSLPKEPRQKMVNMMYLVLTALLALNVSSEILNAFKTVNTSITNANGVIDNKNAAVYKSFEEMIADPKTQEKAKFWQPFAAEARKYSAEMDAYLRKIFISCSWCHQGQAVSVVAGGGCGPRGSSP